MIEEGTMVRCKVSSWYSAKNGKSRNNEPVPQKDEICIACGHDPAGKEYLLLQEYPGHYEDGELKSFHEIGFEIIQPPMVVSIESLISQPQTV